jgi:hypothetical protein
VRVGRWGLEGNAAATSIAGPPEEAPTRAFIPARPDLPILRPHSLVQCCFLRRSGVCPWNCKSPLSVSATTRLIDRKGRADQVPWAPSRHRAIAPQGDIAALEIHWSNPVAVESREGPTASPNARTYRTLCPVTPPLALMVFLIAGCSGTPASSLMVFSLGSLRH